MQYGKPGPSDSARVVVDSEVTQLGIVRIRTGKPASRYHSRYADHDGAAVRSFPNHSFFAFAFTIAQMTLGVKPPPQILPAVFIDRSNGPALMPARSRLLVDRFLYPFRNGNRPDMAAFSSLLEAGNPRTVRSFRSSRIHFSIPEGFPHRSLGRPHRFPVANSRTRPSLSSRPPPPSPLRSSSPTT
jgi:hypothetical protein